MIYVLLLLSGLLFSLQFCVNKYYQTYKPIGETSSTLYTLLGKTAAAVVFLGCVLLQQNALWGNGYTVLVGLAQALLNLLITLIGIRVLAIGSMAVYTVAMMIGGMAVPVLFGVFLLGDPFGWTRIVAFVMIAAAVVLSVRGDGKKMTAKALLLYAVIFLCNGFIGVFTTLHSNLWGPNIADTTFMFTTSAVATVFYLPILLTVYCIERKKGISLRIPQEMPLRRQKAIYYVSPYLSGILNGVANFLIVIGTASDGVGSAATFPLITGGTILFTTVLSWIIYKEKFTVKALVSALLIVVALVIFIL